MARYSTGEYGQREKDDYLEEYFKNHIEDYVIQELKTEHDIGEDPSNHTAEFLNDDFEEFPKFDISNREKELETFITDFENID